MGIVDVVNELVDVLTPDGVPAPAPVTSRSDPAAFMGDPGQLATFIEKLRASGVKHFAHPSGLVVTFEGPARPVAPSW